MDIFELKAQEPDNPLKYQKMMIWQDGGAGMIETKDRYYTITRSLLLEHFSYNWKL